MKFFNFLRFFTSPSFFSSIKFLVFLNTRKTTDVLFYFPQSFNSTINYPICLLPLIESVKRSSLSCKIVEEPDVISLGTRSSKAIPFDFIWFLVIVFRKFYKGKNYNSIDIKIGKILSKVLFIRQDIRNIVTISQSFQSVFRGMFPNASLYDYQHGLISSRYYGYINGDSIAEHILINQSKVLLYGNGFKNILLKIDGGEYFKKHSFVIGSNCQEYKTRKTSFNGNILFTLQFTASQTPDLNRFLLLKTLEFFKSLEEMGSSLTIYIKSHPRFDNCININELYHFNFVKNAPKSLDRCFEICTLHITEYSSVVFDSIIEGIPTLLTAFSEEMSIYQNEYSFPNNNLTLIDQLQKVNDASFYEKLYDQQTQWVKDLYQPFDEKKFIDLMK